MKKNYKRVLCLILLSFMFIACSTKNENYVADSQNEDISNLLKKLIEKEEEINELKKKLEECQNKISK